MDEYISREATAKAFCEKCKGYYDGHCVHRGECDVDVIKTAPTADVQPVNQWISVKDRLPENAKPCAVVTEDNGLGVSRYMGRNRFEWTLFGKRVLYWMSLPEPPKDGDAE